VLVEDWQFVYIETRRTTQCMQSGVNAIKRTGDYLVPYMASYLMNHYLRKYLINIWCVLFHRRNRRNIGGKIPRNTENK
jgi:hypothetical protein